jgi:hypothetical protein
MRLYNQESCTPVGIPTLSGKRADRSPPKAWIPRRSSPEGRSFLSPRRSVSFQELRDDPAEVISARHAAAHRCRSSNARPEGREQGTRASPMTLTEWPFHARESPIRRQVSWSPVKTKSSAILLPRAIDAKRVLSPTFKLKPRPTKKNRVPSASDMDLSPNLASLSLNTEIGETDELFSIPKLSSTDESSADSSTWLDFSLDSANPFHETEDGANRKASFSPIRKAKRQRNAVMMVKPMPMHLQNERSPRHVQTPRHVTTPHFYSYGSSAFVVTRRSSSFRRSAKTSDAYSASIRRVPSRTPPPHRQSPRREMSMASTHQRPLSPRRTVLTSKHLSTYSGMLKSGVAFDDVQSMMKRDRHVDPSVVELLRLAHEIGSS